MIRLTKTWKDNIDEVKVQKSFNVFFKIFRVHDFDNNTKLDGLEILQAIQHTVHSHDQSSKGETSPEDFQHYVGRFSFF